MTYTTEQIKKMLGKITPGEWVADEWKYTQGHTEEDGAYVRVNIPYGEDSADRRDMVCGYAHNGIELADAQFIAASPAIVRQLLEKIEDLGKMEQIQKDNSRAQFKAMHEKIEELEYDKEVLNINIESKDSTIAVINSTLRRARERIEALSTSKTT